MDSDVENSQTFSNASFDPFLESLVYFTERYQISKSKDALCAGLPLENGKLNPTLFLRAAERAGLSAKISQGDLLEISDLLFPVILQLKNNQLIILLSLDREKNLVQLYDLEKKKNIESNLLELTENYSGFCILVQLNQTSHSTKSDGKISTAWFWETLWTYKQYYSHVLIGACLINIFTLVTPLFTLNVYDRVIPNNSMTTLWVLFSGVCLIFVFDFLLRTLRGYLVDFSGKKAVVSMETALLERMLGMQLKYKPQSIGAYVGQFREFEFLKDFFASATLTTLVDFPFLILFLMAIGYVGGMVVLVPLLMIPLLLLVIYIAHTPTQIYVRQWGDVLARRNGLLVESLSGLETLKSTRAEGVIQQEWEKLVSIGGKLNVKSRFVSGLISNIMFVAQQLLTVLMIVVGAYLINSGRMTMGGLIACTILGGRIIAPFNQLVNMIMRFEQAKNSLNNLSQIMATPNERQDEKHFLIMNDFEKEMRLEKLSFSYENKNSNALDSLSLKISKGEKIGLLGRTGSGKTTLLKLLAGFYTPENGQIFIDNIDIAQFDPGDYRKQVNYLPQESVLFSGSLRKNILFGKPTASDAELVEKSRLAGVEPFVRIHPFGFDMPVGERGEGLSGGQRQAVAIARMLLMDPNILLWDEPTSAMDDLTENELVQHLESWIAPKTLVVATHKMSLLRLVDRVIVIHAGKILMDGPRDEVIKQLTQPKPQAAQAKWS